MQRKVLSPYIKETILIAQKYQCNECKLNLTKIGVHQFDHIVPHSVLNNFNTRNNIQALCCNCHALKSNRENRRIKVITLYQAITQTFCCWFCFKNYSNRSELITHYSKHCLIHQQQSDISIIQDMFQRKRVEIYNEKNDDDDDDDVVLQVIKQQKKARPQKVQHLQKRKVVFVDDKNNLCNDTNKLNLLCNDKGLPHKLILKLNLRNTPSTFEIFDNFKNLMTYKIHDPEILQDLNIETIFNLLVRDTFFESSNRVSNFREIVFELNLDFDPKPTEIMIFKKFMLLNIPKFLNNNSMFLSLFHQNKVPHINIMSC